MGCEKTVPHESADFLGITTKQVWLGGRDSAPKRSKPKARCAAPEDVPSSQTIERSERVWLGVRDGIRNWLVTAARLR